MASHPPRTSDVVIVGGGVIGLTTAFELARRGHSPVVVDPYPGRGASYVAAGMVAPITEATYAESAFSALAVEAASRWPAFADALAAHTHLSCGFERAGTLLVGVDENDRATLESYLPLYRAIDVDVEWRSTRDLRKLEPLVSPAVRGGFFAQSDVQVDNRRLLAALGDALVRLGVRHVRATARAVLTEGDRAVGVDTDAGPLLATTTVVCPGYQVGAIAGVPATDAVVVRPVKGQIIRAYQHDASLRPAKTIRGLVSGSTIYVVPRETGQLVIGATVEEQGESFSPTLDGAYALLRDARAVLPSLAEAELLSVDVGLRPATPDNLPVVGMSALPGLVLAVGHYRHGVLLAPATAVAVAELVATGTAPAWIAPFAPGRTGPAS